MAALVTLAKIGATHGVKGDLKLFDFTESGMDQFPRQALQIQVQKSWQSMPAFTLRPYKKDWLIHVEGYNSPEAAQALVNAHIGVPRSALPEPKADEVYWSDLEGLQVTSTDGQMFGAVDHVMETGANDVLVVKGERERLIPYIDSVIMSVNLTAGTIVVDWPSDF